MVMMTLSVEHLMCGNGSRRLLGAMFWLSLAFGAHASPVRAQLTLAGALRRGDSTAIANRAARATTELSTATSLTPLRGILPAVRLESGFLRTTDPIGAFGTRLKQREITQGDFDPARLNYPNGIGNYSAAIVAEQPIFNGESWLARRAATRNVSATRAGATWTRVSTHADVIRAYYGAVLAAERVNTLDAAAAAAQAHVRQAESMVRAGMATKSDALLASIRAGDVDAQRAEARNDAGIARRQLAVLIGLGAAVQPQLPATLPAPSLISSTVAADTLDDRPAARADLDAARLTVDAARADVVRARSTYLPRVNAFARYDWNSPVHLYGGDRNWTVGVLASWAVFDGASRLAETQSADARLDLARASADAAADQARIDVERSLATLRTALIRLDIAQRAVAQGVEAHRIVSRKYAGGLATITELLDAAAGEMQTKLALSSAQHGAITAAAERRRALGGDPATLTVLDRASALADTRPE